MTRNRILILLGFLGGLFLAYCILSLPLKAETDIDLSDNKYYIAHAGGGINGHVYTNCKEALIQSLERGYQFIELDFCLTSDRHLVCAHGASVFNEKTNGNRDSLNIMPDLSTFKRRKIHDEYTPITANDVLKIIPSRRRLIKRLRTSRNGQCSGGKNLRIKSIIFYFIRIINF